MRHDVDTLGGVPVVMSKANNQIERAHRLLEADAASSDRLRTLISELSQSQGLTARESSTASPIDLLETELDRMETAQIERRSNLDNLARSLSSAALPEAVSNEHDWAINDQANTIEGVPLIAAASTRRTELTAEQPEWLEHIVSLGPAQTESAPKDPSKAHRELSHPRSTRGPVSDEGDSISDGLPMETSAFEHRDYWESLKIGNYQESGAPTPISPIDTSSSAQQTRRRPTQSLHPMEVRSHVPEDDLGKAVDVLLSSPPMAVPAEHRSDGRHFHMTLTDYVTSAAITHDGGLHTAHTLAVGPASVTCSLRVTLEVGDTVHVFFTLPDGSDIESHCSVQSIQERPNELDAEVLLKFLNVSPAQKESLVQFVYASTIGSS